MAKRTPTYEETEKLLRAPFRKATVSIAMYAMGERLEVGTTVQAKPYHNDPDGWVSIRFRDSAGELHEFTESDDRIEYADRKALEALLAIEDPTTDEYEKANRLYHEIGVDFLTLDHASDLSKMWEKVAR